MRVLTKLCSAWRLASDFGPYPSRSSRWPRRSDTQMDSSPFRTPEVSGPVLSSWLLPWGLRPHLEVIYRN